jgi:tetraacyldisaccharide 4'-kinase
MREPSSWWSKPGPMAALLSPLAAFYDAVAVHRLRLPGVKAAVPVICIGNPTVGGAGKTPTAIAIARMLIAAERVPAFLTRGYGGRLSGPVEVAPSHTAGEVGDEPLLLARTATTIVARDRAAGVAMAVARGADVVVMDDGFQNPAVRKDFSLLVVDAMRGIGNGRVFPAGPMRANLDAQLSIAHALLVVGENAVATRPVVTSANDRGLPIWRAQLKPDSASLAMLTRKPVLAFAGIASPEKFFATLDRAGIAVAARVGFPDHHAYTPAEAVALMQRGEREGLDLVTTEKDHVRLAGSPELAALSRACKVLPVTLQFEQAEDVRTALLAVVSGFTSATADDGA